MIRCVHKLDSPQRTMFKSIFANLYDGYGDVKALTDNPTQDMLSQIDVPAGFIHQTARTVLAVQQVYRSSLDLIDMMGAGFGESRLQSMRDCMMPGVKHIPDLPIIIQCDQYIICPGCRFRLEISFYKKLRPMLRAGRRIGVLPIGASLGEYVNKADAPLQVNAVLDEIYKKKWRTWLGDVTCVLPCYMPEKNMWMALGLIIAVAESDDDFWDPKERLGLNTMWRTYPATEAGLARAISQWCKYNPKLIYTESAATTAKICRMMTTDNGPVCRTRMHGDAEVPKRTPKQTYRQVDKEIYIDTNRTGIRSGHASETPDVAKPLGDQEGCVPRIAADSGVLYKEPTQPITRW